jgi:hypothetical protein
MYIQGPSEVHDTDFTLIDDANPLAVGLRVANSGVGSKVIGANLIAKYASQVGFTTTYHASTNVDKQGRSRRVDITCIQGGKPRATGKKQNLTVCHVCLPRVVIVAYNLGNVVDAYTSFIKAVVI